VWYIYIFGAVGLGKGNWKTGEQKLGFDLFFVIVPVFYYTCWCNPWQLGT